MTADQAPGQAGKAQAVVPRLARAIARPGGMDINWDQVHAVVGIIGAITLLHGLKTRSWRYAHTATTVLAVGTIAAGRLQKRYAEASRTAENK